MLTAPFPAVSPPPLPAPSGAGAVLDRFPISLTEPARAARPAAIHRTRPTCDY